jgi:hypothetical protein
LTVFLVLTPDLRGCSALTDASLVALKNCEGLELLYLGSMPKVTRQYEARAFLFWMDGCSLSLFFSFILIVFAS